jgi:hypothetical protein
MRIYTVLIAIGLVLLFRHPRQALLAFAGIASYWLGDIFCLWATLHAFEARTPPVAQLLVAYATGYSLTRRALPLGGAGVVEALLPFALGWVAIARAPAVVGVALPANQPLATASPRARRYPKATAARSPVEVGSSRSLGARSTKSSLTLCTGPAAVPRGHSMSARARIPFAAASRPRLRVGALVRLERFVGFLEARFHLGRAERAARKRRASPVWEVPGAQ